jgi:hypothetical protein
MRNGSARPGRGLTLLLTAAVTILVTCAGSGSTSEARPAAEVAPASAYQVKPETTLEDLVAPIALYPDDLLAILLPASAYPLDVVQASRFLDRLEKDKSLQPDPAWDESVRNLLNTPEVVDLMAENLDWTIRLGEEVATDQSAVMEAIQEFRRRVDSAGNLESDDRQKVIVEEEAIRIETADPQVIYVPQYSPQVVVVPAPVPVVTYYPTPYPVYYYPYPPGYHFATGFFFGAATAFAFSWGAHAIHHGIHHHHHHHHGWRGGDVDIHRGDIHIDRSVNVSNRRTTEIDRPGGAPRPGAGGRPGDGSAWRPESRPGQRPGSSVGQLPRTRPGDPGYRPSPGRRPGSGGELGAGSRPSYGGATRPSTRPSTGVSRERVATTRSRTTRDARPPSRSGSSYSGSFSGYGSSRQATASSSRGRSSRAHVSRGGGGRRGGGRR